MKEKLFAFLLKDLKIDDVIKDANGKIDQLNTKYKI